MNANRLVRVLCVTALAMPALAGCQLVVKESDGGSPEIQVGGANVTVTGKGDTLPAGFPSDVPLASDAKITSSNAVSSGSTTLYSVKYETASDATTIDHWYRSILPASGWVLTNEGATAGATGLSAQKGESQLKIRSSRPAGSAATKVTITVNK